MLYHEMDKKNNICSYLLLSFLFILTTLCTSTASATVKAAYWSEDSVSIQSIDSTLFTHLFVAFATLDATTYHISVPDSFAQFTSVVRAKNPNVKTLLSIGGGGGDSIADAFSSMSASSTSRKAFIDSSIQISFTSFSLLTLKSFARANSFDGLDIDYEIPRNKADMSNLGILLSEWRSAVNSESRSSNKAALLLTAAVRYTNTNYYATQDPYPAASIAANLDWINIMAYDFTAPVSWGDPKTTGATAPLNGVVSGSSGVSDWIRAGVPATKIVLGIPFYGYAWKLADASNHGYGAPATGPAVNGDGAVTYRQIKAGGYCGQGRKVYDSSKGGNYCYQGTTWISFDDVEAVSAKVKYVVQNKLLGYFAWQISGDDVAFTLSKAAASSL